MTDFLKRMPETPTEKLVNQALNRIDQDRREAEVLAICAIAMAIDRLATAVIAMEEE